MKRTLTILAILFLVPFNAQPQDLGTILKKVSPEYAINYLQPFASSFGMNLNSGFIGGYAPSSYSKIPIHPHFYVGFKAVGTFLTDVDKVFSLAYNAPALDNAGNSIIDPGTGQVVNAVYQANNVPTVFGNTSAPVIHGTYYLGGAQQSTQMTTIGGIWDTKISPLAMPQIGVGTIYGTDLMIRALPKIKIGDYGEIGYFGFAVRHSVSSYLKKIPFELAAQFGWQTFGVTSPTSGNKFIDANAWMVNVQAFKRIKIVGIYGGIQYENFTMDVNYVYNEPGTNKPIPVAFSENGANKFRFMAGANVYIGPVVFNLDLAIANKFILSAGLGGVVF